MEVASSLTVPQLARAYSVQVVTPSEDSLNPCFKTSAISALYSTLLTSPQTGAVLTGAVSTAIELASSSQTSANTDKAAFLEAASALFCASVIIFAEIAWNHWTKLLIGVTSAPACQSRLRSEGSWLKTNYKVSKV